MDRPKDISVRDCFKKGGDLAAARNYIQGMRLYANQLEYQVKSEKRTSTRLRLWWKDAMAEIEKLKGGTKP